MHRAAILSIVALLALGPDAAAFCAGWCDAGVRVAHGCSHAGMSSAPVVTGQDDCGTMMVVSVFVREDVRDADTGMGAWHATVLPAHERHASVAMLNARRVARELDRLHAQTPLRI